MTMKLVSALDELAEVTRQFFEKKPEVTFTRKNVPAIVFTRNGGGDYPVVGAYFNGECWVPCCWLSDGRFGSVNEKVICTDLDIDLPKTT